MRARTLSGNGKPDVLVFDQNNNGGTPSSLLVLPGNGTGESGHSSHKLHQHPPTMVVAADMNHDTKPDAVLAGYSLSASPQLSVLINQGNGTFAGEQDYALPNTPVSLAVGDFNGDGIPDVAVGVTVPGRAVRCYVLFGQANGTLGAPVQIDSSLNPTGLAAGSLTTDGRTDLVVADQGSFNYVGSASKSTALCTSTWATPTAPLPLRRRPRRRRQTTPWPHSAT